MKLPRNFFLLVLAAVTAGVVRTSADTPRTHPLVWDAMEKTADAKPGDGAAEFTFQVTNKSDHAVTIDAVRPSCHCTVADLPSTPWKLAPGAGGAMRVTVDLRGKEGRITKTLEVDSPEGLQTLFVTVNIPVPDETRRLENQRLALANRQAVFRGDCASCHVAPIGAKTGGELFLAACAICHISPHRASMVPDLLVARDHRDAAFWRKSIAEGREQTLMPAFAQEHGGPLNAEQIESLVDFALHNLPTDPPAKN